MRIGFLILDSNPNKEHSDNPLEYQCDAVHQGIGYVAAFAKKHLAIRDCQLLRTSDLSDETLIDFLSQSWDVIGISFSLFALQEVQRISEIIKSVTVAKIVVGGPEVTNSQDEILNLCPAVDYAVYGEGEVTFCDLLNCIKSRGDFSTINGLIFRDTSGQVNKNSPRGFVSNLEMFPRPDRSLFKYEYNYHSIIGTRGCPFSCTFCNSSHIWGHKYRLRRPESVLEEIKYISDQFGQNKLFIFQDDTFNYDKKWVLSVCRLIKPLNITWRIRGCRADLITEEIAEALATSGCIGVACGVESANNLALRAMQKGTKIEDIMRGVSLLQISGITVVGNFMIGNVGDTLDSTINSFEYASFFSQADFRIAYPIPHTQLFEYLKLNNLLLPEPIPIVFSNKIIGKLLFSTPEFPVIDRVEAVNLAIKAKLLHNIVF